jgi:hypothetical protein
MNEMMEEVTGEGKDKKAPEKEEGRGSQIMLDLAR